MSKHILFAATILLSLGAFTPALAQKKDKTTTSKSDVKFLDNISINADPVRTNSDPKAAFAEPVFTSKKVTEAPINISAEPSSVENASALQFKYALLMDTEVEELQNLELLKNIDEWYGTRYRLGGTTKSGIDCSALMQILMAGVYGASLPRTAREQYHATKRISRTEIREGDLIFFNTIGGISHVGMYLQNNKFIHASKSGVTISDMYEDYWMKKFIGAGRVESLQTSVALTLNP